VWQTFATCIYKIDKTTGLFRKRALQKRQYSAKETCNHVMYSLHIFAPCRCVWQRQRCIRRHALQVSFCKRATIYRALSAKEPLIIGQKSRQKSFHVHVYDYKVVQFPNTHPHTRIRVENHLTGWRKRIRCLLSMGHFLQKSPTISDSFHPRRKSSYRVAKPTECVLYMIIRGCKYTYMHTHKYLRHLF